MDSSALGMKHYQHPLRSTLPVLLHDDALDGAEGEPKIAPGHDRRVYRVYGVQYLNLLE